MGGAAGTPAAGAQTASGALGISPTQNLSQAQINQLASYYQANGGGGDGGVGSSYSGGSQAAGGRIPRRADGGISPSMEFPSWSRMQSRGEDVHPSGLIP